MIDASMAPAIPPASTALPKEFGFGPSRGGIVKEDLYKLSLDVCRRPLKAGCSCRRLLVCKKVVQKSIQIVLGIWNTRRHK